MKTEAVLFFFSRKMHIFQEWQSYIHFVINAVYPHLQMPNILHTLIKFENSYVLDK